MNNTDIYTYLNDHLAGSVAALELIEHLIKRHPEPAFAQFFSDLERDIKADQGVLRQLLRDMHQRESALRKVAAWIAEKLLRTKFAIAGEEFGELGLVQAFETLALGIRGKQLLWRGLRTCDWPSLKYVDLVRLEDRAIEQQERVEERRLAAFRQAFQ